MGKLYLNKKELEVVREEKAKHLLKRKKIFIKKKLNHINSKRLKAFYKKHITAQPSDILYTIKFRSSLSFYLYLYLKSLVVWYGEFKNISQPIEINFWRIHLLSGMVKNTVKKSFRELVDVGLVIYNKDVIHKHHNSTKSVLVINDECLIGFDEKNNKVIYSIDSKDRK